MQPALETVKKIEYEYSLRDELDSAWAVRPLALYERCGQMTLVLEDPGGETLDRLLPGPVEMTRFLRFAVGTAAALSGLHEKELIHKDVKPANVLVNPATGQARLMGFGIASRLPRERQAPEPPEFIAGTLAYMAPEQTGRMNRSIDSRSDLYALGVTLYEMVTGALPFTASDPMELVHYHIARQPAPPEERWKGTPGMVSAIVMKLLAKTAEERYQTAAGAASDLRRCLDEWETKGRIDEFPLGEHDTPDRLLIPEKLYGRAPEIETLLAAFDRVVAGGRPELVLVSGYSGIGKSSVVNELHKPLVPPRGLFASGKFDQYKRDIPYATLAQAFQSLIRLLLSKSEKELSKWRDALREALDPNGQLIVDLVPELKLIIGEQPPVPELPPQDAQGRFQLVFRRFISVFTREHPLALFFDDLQWLDAATLDLMEDLLTQPDAQHLLLIGAYRDNEVNPTHPLMRKLEAIRQAGAIAQNIVLAPLAREDLRQLVADSLHCEPERAQPLAQLIHDKTAGNPFFAIQFFSALAEENLLTFDHRERRWSWDLNRIHAKGYADNVVDLMVGKLNRLPVKTVNALKQLACLGNSAEFALLALVYEVSGEELHSDLKEGLRTGLVLHSEGAYKFLHDRVREAAYSLIPEHLRPEAHLRIGRLLAGHTPLEKREEAIFEIVNQLNRGAALITSQDEREQLAELNLIAGKRAKTSSAYASALNYLIAGAALLAGDCWERRPELILALELYRAECEFLTGELATAETRLTTLASRAANAIDQAAVACLRVDLYTTLDRSDRAVDVCLAYLRHLGIDWSPHPPPEQARREYERTLSLLGSRAIEELVDLPLMSDASSLATQDVLTKVVPAALFTDANLLSLVVCRMVNLSLEHGNSDGSCFAYVFLGMVAGPHFDNYQGGFQFGRLGYALVEKRSLLRYRARTYMSFGSFVMPWTRHVRTGRDLVRRAFDVANKMGDLTFGAYSCNNLNTNLLAAGDALAETQSEAEHGLEFAHKARFGLVIAIITAQLQLIRTLRGLTPAFGRFDEEQFDERRFEHDLASKADLALAECWYWIRKLQARVLAGDYRSAVDASSRARPLLWTSPSFFETAEYEFYSGLCRAALCDCTSPDERSIHFEALAAHYRQLEIWAGHCPDNFENRTALVGAEIARLEGRELEAEHLYEKAIRSAHANGFVQNAALASELAARFYAVRGFERIKDAYLQDARQGYLRWGANGKVEQLDHLYPHLGEETPSRNTTSTTAGPIGLPVRPHVKNESARGATSTILAPVELLDLATVIKVSQAVSGEMVLEKLIDRLMRAAIEHAGAERGLLIVLQGDDLHIEAEATTGGEDVTVHLGDGTPIPAALPESLVRYVMRTREVVILDDASVQTPFSVDPYIVECRAHSVLCLPLVNQTRLFGILYLENNLTPYVFTPGRVAVLKVLASQAGISLENSRLYRDLEDREGKIRRLFDANILGLFIWNLEGAIVEANEAFLRMLQYDRDDLVSGRVRWTDLTPTEARERDERGVTELKETGTLQPYKKEFFRKDGSRVPVLIGAALFQGGGNEGVAFVLDLSEQKRAEEALRRSESYLAEAQRLSQTGSWAWSPEQGIRYWSEECYRVLSFDPQDGLPRFEDLVQRLHPDDQPGFRELVQTAIREKAEWETDYRIVHPDGAVRDVHVVGHPVLGTSGNLVEFVGTVIDVTERRHAEQRLLVQYRVTRILAEAATLDEATPKILQAMCECLGWDRGSLWRIDREAGVLRHAELWHAPSVVVPQFDAATRMSTFRYGSGILGRVWASRAPIYIPDIAQDPEVPHRDAAAREGLHAAFAFPILLGSEVLGVMGFLSRNAWRPDQDLLDMMATLGSQIGQFTKRTAAVDELQLRVSMLQNIPVAAWSVTPDGTPDIVNQAWFEYTGQTPEDVTSHPEAWMATIHPEDRERASESYWDGIRSGRGFMMEARFLRASDGTYRWHLNRAVPVRDPEGNMLRLVGTSTDVHDWRQAQEALRNTQAEFAHMTRVMTMGELTASIAHEVNQPLGAIVTSAAAGARWLATKPPQLDKARRALDRIANDGKRAAEVIRRIRMLMKRQAPRKEWLDINETILEVMALAQYQLRRSEILAATRLGHDLPLVRCDRVQLQQVLLNLIINAIEAMNGIKERSRELTIVSALERPDTVSVEVRDTGTGLDPEHAPHLFEPFYTTKAEGLGIGLSISRSILEAHGGRLSAAANPPHGTVFSFSVPVNEPAP
jgi:PAS domain S-box-containing protein